MSIIIFIVILAVLVLVHEFGHYIVAKKSGMEVQEFGFGFPPRLFGFKKGETLYSVNLIPLGGFVKIVGQDNDEENNPRSFVNKSFRARFLTLVAGVIMNFLLACVLLAVGFGLGLPTAVSSESELPKGARLSASDVRVLQIAKDSPAFQAGLKEGDQIVSVDGQAFTKIDEIISYVKTKGDQNINLKIKRGSEEKDLQVFSRANPPAGEGATGIALANVGRVSFPWYQAPVMGVRSAWNITEQTFIGLYSLIARGEGLESLGGPVKIAALTGQVTKLGYEYVIQFAAVLSVNLAILNILPFPALDGGRVVFLLIEKIRGKRNSGNIEAIVNTAGFVLLMALIIWITIRDVSALIG